MTKSKYFHEKQNEKKEFSFREFRAGKEVYDTTTFPDALGRYTNFYPNETLESPLVTRAISDGRYVACKICGGGVSLYLKTPSVTVEVVSRK